MIPPDPRDAETRRLDALRRYDVLDTPREQDFDDLSQLAAQICQTPVALISFVDAHRQWFKSEIGLGMSETTLENSICQRAILENEMLVVPDTLADPRFRAMPICVGDPHLRFYAGAVIRTSDGHALGSVCVLDYQPRELSPEQLAGLRILARQVVSMLELRRRVHDERSISRSLAHSEQRYRTVMEAAADVLWTNSAEGEMCGEQPGWGRFTGQTYEEYQGYGWSHAVHPDDAQPSIDAWRRAVETRTRFDFQHRVRRADGEWRYCLVRALPTMEEGEIREWVGVHTDITDVKRAEDRLRIALQNANEANSAKDEFLAKLSHELRTPLTPVLMTLGELLEEPELSPRLRDHLTLIFRNVELEARLIDDLLDVTRIVHGKLELHEEPCDVHRLVDHALQICAPALRQRKITVSAQLTATAHRVVGDPTRLQQVFWNLLTNAGKFVAENGTIQIVSTNPTPDLLRIEVIDDGVGIEPELIPALFHVFEQGDRAVTRKFGGLGLGLAICKGVVDLHGGTIRAHSAGPGRGTTITVELPRLCAAPAAPVQAIAAARGGSGTPPLRLLFVEDHESTAQVMLRLLRRAGHEVLHAETLSAARELAGGERFDLVVSDLGLPDGTGIELMSELRDLHGLRGIALSGYGTHNDIAASREAGFIRHLLKPVEWKHLESALREFAENQPAGN